jgi:hypothetical protein
MKTDTRVLPSTSAPEPQQTLSQLLDLFIEDVASAGLLRRGAEAALAEMCRDLERAIARELQRRLRSAHGFATGDLITEAVTAIAMLGIFGTEGSL